MSREEPVPSFMLMDLQGMSLVLYIYTLENGQIKVEKARCRLKLTLTIVIISERGVIDRLDWLQVWLHNGTLHLSKV
jgi:hypothetical protein